MSDEEISSEADDGDDERTTAGVSADLENHEYRNWVKGAKGLDYLQQGLAPFVDRIIASQHSIFKNKLPAHNTACGCNFQNILPDHDTRLCPVKGCLCKKKSGRRKCPNNGYCSTLCQLIITEHIYNQPFWENSDINVWPSDHWSIAKCFMTTRCPSNSAQTTDAAGLLSIIINARFFQTKVANPGIFKKARETRNEILHKAKMRLTDKEVVDSIDGFTAVLKDTTMLLHDQDAVKAVENLESLKAGKIVISTAEEEEIIRARTNAIMILKQIQEERDKSIEMIREESDKVRRAAEISVNTKMTDSLNSIEEKKTAALELVVEARTDALASVDQAGAMLEEKKTDALASVDEARASLEEKKTDVLASVDEARALLDEKKTDALSSVDEARASLDEKKTDVLASVDEARASLEEKKTDVLASVDEARASLEEKKTDVLASVDEAKASLDEKKTDALSSVDEARASLDEKKTDVLASVDEAKTHVLREIHTCTTQRETIAKEKQEKSMEKDRKDLRRNLAELFKTHHIKTSVCPLKTNDNDFVIHEVYVTPNLTKEIKKPSPDGSKEVKHVSLNDISEIFKSKGNPPHAIYILGEVGSGKSAICKELMYKWCQSVDRRADTPSWLTEFEFLFYLPLRNFHGNNNVRRMIYSDYGYMVSKEVLDDVLLRTPDKCLILMDGLDEWSPPTTKVHGHVTYGLPDSRDLHHATIVTTSRPSAQGVLNMKSSECDQKIYLNGIQKTYVEEIVVKYSSKMGRKGDKNVSANEIFKKLGDLKLSDLEKTPMLLQQIIWLLNEGKEIGDSVSAVYSSMLNIAFRWLEEKSPEDDTQRECQGVRTLAFPESIEEFTWVDSYRHHICVMSEIAFDIMTNECHSKTMIGRKYLRKRGIGENLIRDILETGLLKKQQCNDPTQESTHYTFVHQSFLEYFAALHVASQHHGSEASSVNHVTALFRSCKTVQDVLQLENVLVLISGLAPHMISDVFAHIYHIAENDKQYLKNREQVLKDRWPMLIPKQCAVQTLLMRCLSEGQCDTVSCRQELSLVDLTLDTAVNQVVNEQKRLFKYVDPKTVLQLHVVHSFNPFDVITLKNFVHKPIVYVLKNIDQFKILQIIRVCKVSMSHKELAKLSAYISSTASLTGIGLQKIKCVDHRDCKHQINLSRHNKLKILNITGSKVFHISNHNTTHLECCITDQEDIVTLMTGAEKLKVIDFSYVQLKPQAIVNIINQNLLLTKITIANITESKLSRHAVVDLSGHSELRHWEVTDAPALHVTKLNTSNLEYCQTDNTDLIYLLGNSPKLEELFIEFNGLYKRAKLNANICQVLNTLSQLRRLWIRTAYIEDNALRMIPDMISLSRIMLVDVRMSLPTWRTFVDSLLTLKQKVHVHKYSVDKEEKTYISNYAEEIQVINNSDYALHLSCLITKQHE